MELYHENTEGQFNTFKRISSVVVVCVLIQQLLIFEGKRKKKNLLTDTLWKVKPVENTQIS